MVEKQLSMEQVAFVESYYEAWYRKLFLYARSSLQDQSLSEEAVQETFRIACASIDRFYGSPNPVGWLIRTLSNVIRNIRKNRFTMSKYIIELSEFDIENIAAGPDFTAMDIETRFGDIALSDDFAMLKRVVLDKCTIKEVSTEYGLSVEACKKRIQRLKKKIIGDP